MSGGRKRYSLRKGERRDFRSEESVLAAVRKESKITFEEAAQASSPMILRETTQGQTINNNNNNSNGSNGAKKVTRSYKRKKPILSKTVNDDINNKKKKVTDKENMKDGSRKRGRPRKIRESDSREPETRRENHTSEKVVPSPYMNPNTDDEENDDSSVDDVPVYYALSHAMNCRDSSLCCIPKCSIAKYFLIHYCSSTTCKRMSGSCTFCKAMDIMIRKHADSCEVPINSQCVVPNCDKQRHTLHEQRNLARNNEMMDRVFRACLHAGKCYERNCEESLCRHVKMIRLHRLKCNKETNSCPTSKFVETFVNRLFEHQQICPGEGCEFASCREMKLLFLKQEWLRQLQLYHEHQQWYKLMSLANTLNIMPPQNFIPPPPPPFAPFLTGAGGLAPNMTAVPSPPIMCTGPMGNLLPIGSPAPPNPQYCYPNPFSSVAFYPHSINPRHIYNTYLSAGQSNHHDNAYSNHDNTYSNHDNGYSSHDNAYSNHNNAYSNHNNSYFPEQHGNQSHVEAAEDAASDESVSYPIPDDDDPEQPDDCSDINEDEEETHQQHPGFYQVSTPVAEKSINDAILSYAPDSPTSEMYYKLLAEKIDGGGSGVVKSTLPSLLPSDLKILTGGDDDSGENYSTPDDDVSTPDYSQPSSSCGNRGYYVPQEEEKEEDPLPKNYHTDHPDDEAGAAVADKGYSYRKKIDDDEEMGDVRDIMTSGRQDAVGQGDWSRIDFVKQHMMDAHDDADTETADESEGEFVPDDEKPPNNVGGGNRETSIKQNFLDALKEKK